MALSQKNNNYVLAKNTHESELFLLLACAAFTDCFTWILHGTFLGQSFLLWCMHGCAIHINLVPVV